MPFTEDEFKRLPPDVQRETLESERNERLAEAEYQQRMKKREFYGAGIAAAGAMMLSIVVSDNPAFFLLMGAVAGGAGWLSIRLRYKMFGGMALIGGACVFVNAISSAAGLCAPIIPLWLIYIGFGALVGAWGDARRFREDIGF